MIFAQNRKNNNKKIGEPCSQNTLHPHKITHTVPLIGKKTLLKCFISGYAATVLFDTGSQVSIIDRSWRERFILRHPVRPLDELVDAGESFRLYAANGQSIPYDGWVELMVNLPGNDNPDLAVQVPFLVSQLPLPQPIIGSNVLDEMISGPQSSAQTHAMVISLLQKALGVEEDQAIAMVSFTQVQKTSNDEKPPVQAVRAEVNVTTPAPPPADLWQPPVDLSHLKPEQQ